MLPGGKRRKKSMTIYVHYEDGNCCNGDYGLESCNSIAQAEKFIVGRMARADNPSIKDYKVIEGHECPLTVKKVVAEVKIG